MAETSCNLTKLNGRGLFLSQYQVSVKCFLAFINSDNIQEPTLKAVEYSFNQGQANEINDMQPFKTDGTVYENKESRTDKCASANQLWQICFSGKNN